MAASLSTGRSEVLLDEQFADGERTAQGLPSSAAWFLEASSSAYTSAVADGAWTILPPSPPSKISAASYFSASPVSLAAGESLSISLRIRPTHAKGSLRVGLFNSGGSRARADLAGSSSLFVGYKGYDVNCSLAAGSAMLSRREKSAPGLWTTSAFQPLASAAGTLQTDAGYSVVLIVEKSEDGKLLVTSNVAGVRCTTTDPRGLTSFDTVAIQVDGSMGQTALESIQVKKGPENKTEPTEDEARTMTASADSASLSALAGGSTWYLQFSHTAGLDWTSTNTWFSATAGGGTNPAAISATDTFNLNRFRAYSPPITTGTVTFGGGEMALTASSTLSIRGANLTTTVIPNITAVGGVIANAGGSLQYVSVPNLTVPSGNLNINSGAATRTIVLKTGTLTGGGLITNSGGGGQQVEIGNAYFFTGTLQAYSGTLTFLNDVVTSGPLMISQPAKVNLTKNVTCSSLIVTGTSVTEAPGNKPDSYTYPPGTYSAATLYADNPALFVSGTSGGSITVRGVKTYYLRVNQAVGRSWTDAYKADWNTLADGTGSAAPAVNPLDDYSTNGKSLRTPAVTDTFGGRTLLLEGGGILLKNPQPEIVTVPTLLATSGTIIQNLGVVGTTTMRVNYFTQNSGSTTLMASASQTLDLNVDYLNGGGEIRFAGTGQSLFTVNDASQFTGTYTQASGTLRLSPVASGPVHAIGSPFAMKGRLVVNTGAKVVLNRDAYVGGLTVSGSMITTGTYTAAALGFSGTAKIVVYTPDLAGPPQMFGINFASGTFSLDGALIPTWAADWDFYQARGLTLIRVPIKWQQMQPTLGGSLNTGIMNKLATVLALANARGMKVIFDMHNYGVYSSDTQVIGGTVAYASYQDVWEKVSQFFSTNPDRAALFGFDIMNEPVKMPGDTWQTGIKYAIAGIRKYDMTSYIIVEGMGWAGAQDWTSRNTGLGAVDPACRVIYSAHSYWANSNNDGYGSYDTEKAYPNRSIDKMRPFVDWVKKRKFHGLIGEYGVPTNVASPDLRWHDLLRNGLQYMRDNGISGTYWANGRAFGGYHLAADSGTTPVQEAPPMTVLKDFHQ